MVYEHKIVNIQYDNWDGINGIKEDYNPEYDYYRIIEKRIDEMVAAGWELVNFSYARADDTFHRDECYILFRRQTSLYR